VIDWHKLFPLSLSKGSSIFTMPNNHRSFYCRKFGILLPVRREQKKNIICQRIVCVIGVDLIRNAVNWIQHELSFLITWIWFSFVRHLGCKRASSFSSAGWNKWMAIIFYAFLVFFPASKWDQHSSLIKFINSGLFPSHIYLVVVFTSTRTPQQTRLLVFFLSQQIGFSISISVRRRRCSH
jgi:hypothetical protein